MTCCGVPILDDESHSDHAFVRLQRVSADGLKPSVGADISVAEMYEAEPDAAPPDLAENDEHVGFAFNGSKLTRPNLTRGLSRYVTATAASWGLSIFAHAVFIGIAVVALRLVGLTRPASIDFAYGDGSPEIGLKDRKGTHDLPPGWEGLADALPAPSPAVPKSPPIDVLTESDAVPEESPAAPTHPSVEVPHLPVDSRLATESAVNTPLPKFPSTLQLPEPQAQAQEPQESPSNAPATPKSAMAEGTGASPSLPGNPSGGAAGSLSASGPSGGDGVANGQGGGATGAGGMASTGDPGIPAGLREGHNLPTPVYPEICRRRGERGEVRLHIEVCADGSIGEIRVETDAGHPRLAEAAVASLQGYKFRPALQDGRAVHSTLVVPFRFNLR